MADAHDREIAAMFDRIARRYDRLNRILSFGTDIGWRRRAVARAAIGPGLVVLDVGAGTGDLSLAAAARGARVLALDLSPGMLAVLAHRADRAAGRRRIAPLVASAESLPLPDRSVDRIISGFTVRNVGDLPRALAEFRRVLRPGGRTVILELSHPPGAAFARLYSFYFDHVAPAVAVLLGGDRDAYRYLPRSVRAFPDAERLAALLRGAGFERVSFERLTFGIAALHIAEA